MRWWANRLQWTTAYEGPEDERNAGDVSVTFAECVVDFEASTGLELRNAAGQALGWSEKAARLRSIWRKMASVHTVTERGKISTFNNIYKPKNDVPSLVPLGAPRLPGLMRRPRWVMETTPSVVAANVWKALGSNVERRLINGRTFIRGWRIDCSGFTRKHVWQAEQEKEYGELIDLRVKKEQLRLAVLTDEPWQALAEPCNAQVNKRRRQLRNGQNRSGAQSHGYETFTTHEPELEGKRIRGEHGSNHTHAGAEHDGRSEGDARNDRQPQQPTAAAIRLAALRQRVRQRIGGNQCEAAHSTTFSQAVAQAPEADYCAECKSIHPFGLYRVPKRSSWKRHGPGTSLCWSCFEAAEFSHHQTGL